LTYHPSLDSRTYSNEQYNGRTNGPETEERKLSSPSHTHTHTHLTGPQGSR